MLHARGTLIEASNGAIVWDSVCKLGGAAEDKSLQLDREEFKNNDGQKLKNIIRASAQKCASQFVKGIQVSG